MNIPELKDKFFQRYGSKPEKVSMFFAPGRVNLIGEHTDYNNGYVLPCALSYGTYLLLRTTAADKIRLASVNFDYSTDISTKSPGKKHNNEWVNYPTGVINELMANGVNIGGMELLYAGDIPNGAGLSSSASIEMVTAVAINEIYKGGLGRVAMIKLCQKAENEFIGVNCGIMDQFVVGEAKANNALFLNCKTLDYELVPFKLNSCRLIIANTNKKRELAASKYNERVKECNAAVRYIQKIKKIDSLGELDIETFNEVAQMIPDNTIRKRAKHVVTENRRVLEAVRSLKDGDMENFGKLMNESHKSLKNDYEVTGFELDTMVEEAYKIPDTLGARMTGAGFGGCTVNLVKEEAETEFIEKIGMEYEQKTGLKAGFYIPEIADGARQIE
jgi:galactokinase